VRVRPFNRTTLLLKHAENFTNFGTSLANAHGGICIHDPENDTYYAAFGVMLQTVSYII